MAGGERGADTHAPRLLGEHVGPWGPYAPPWGPYAPRADKLAVGEPKWVRTPPVRLRRGHFTASPNADQKAVGDADRRWEERAPEGEADREGDPGPVGNDRLRAIAVASMMAPTARSTKPRTMTSVAPPR